MKPKFKVVKKDGNSRVGKLETAHGVIETPSFVPVGTKATVKALPPNILEEIGCQIVLGNTYHLNLQPGLEVIEKAGGLHKFMNWEKPIMTDSGGFQVFSLGVGLESGEGKVLKSMHNPGLSTQFQTGIGNSNILNEIENEPLKLSQKVRLAKVTKEGVTFQSHIDGSKYFLGPKESIEIQHKLAADLIVAFDDHESIKYTKDELVKSLELTEIWGLQSLKYHQKEGNSLLYGVVHGATNKELRVRSAKFTDKHFEAIAIGGIYGTKKDLYQIVEWVIDEVEEGKIKHLLGIGEVEDLLNGVERGIDMFDCVAPMRRARNASIYLSPKNGGNAKNNFTLNIAKSEFRMDQKSLDPACLCYTCQNFSRSYLHHLFKAEELLFYYLSTYHNVYFIENLMKQIRDTIFSGQFKKLKSFWLS